MNLVNPVLAASLFDRIGLIAACVIVTAVLYYVFFKNGDSD